MPFTIKSVSNAAKLMKALLISTDRHNQFLIINQFLIRRLNFFFCLVRTREKPSNIASFVNGVHGGHCDTMSAMTSFP